MNKLIPLLFCFAFLLSFCKNKTAGEKVNSEATALTTPSTATPNQPIPANVLETSFFNLKSAIAKMEPDNLMDFVVMPLSGADAYGGANDLEQLKENFNQIFPDQHRRLFDQVQMGHLDKQEVGEALAQSELFSKLGLTANAPLYKLIIKQPVPANSTDPNEKESGTIYHFVELDGRMKLIMLLSMG